MAYKGLLIIIDGLGDVGSPALLGKTPLEAAVTPSLDRMAGEGSCGLIDPLYPGLPVGTHTGAGVLMGLAPADAQRLARGPVEAAGIGLNGRPGDVLLRCNFATLMDEDGEFRIRDRRAGRIREDTDALAEALRDVPLSSGISGHLYPATQHRAVLVLKGSGLSGEVTDTDPGAGRRALGVLAAQALDAEDPASRRTAAAVNRFIREAHSRLKDHPVNRARESRGLLPANGILTRGAGSVGTLRNLVTAIGLKASVVTAERTVEGLGRLFGFRVVTDPAFTALPHTDLVGKLAMAVAELATRDMVFLHIKGPDVCSHDRDPMGKRACLERIDQALSELQHHDLVVGVTGDHSTDSHRGRHCGDPVPCLLLAPGGRRDSVAEFSESACQFGAFGRISSTAFLISLLDAMGVIGNYQPSLRRLLYL